MPIIKNYGFRWDRKHLYRGAGRNKGDLVGIAPGRPSCNFREQIGIYVLYDKEQRIIYVGQAGNGKATLFSRLKQHEKDHLHGRWQYFSWVGFRDVNQDGSLSDKQNVASVVSGFTNGDALNELEGVLIEVIEPHLNRQSGKLKHAVVYFQEPLEYVDLENLSDRISAIDQKLAKLLAGK